MARRDQTHQAPALLCWTAGSQRCCWVVLKALYRLNSVQVYSSLRFCPRVERRSKYPGSRQGFFVVAVGGGIHWGVRGSVKAVRRITAVFHFYTTTENGTWPSHAEETSRRRPIWSHLGHRQVSSARLPSVELSIGRYIGRIRSIATCLVWLLHRVWFDLAELLLKRVFITLWW